MKILVGKYKSHDNCYDVLMNIFESGIAIALIKGLDVKMGKQMQ